MANDLTSQKIEGVITKLVTRQDAPEIYADGYAGVSITNGVAKLNLYSSGLAPTLDGAEHVMVCRLALPVPALIGIVAALNSLLEQMKNDGQIPPSDKSPSGTSQPVSKRRRKG